MTLHTETDERKDQEQAFKNRLRDYLETFTSDTGKRVLKDMRLSYCGQFDPAKDASVLGFDLGKRQVVKDIEAVLVSAKNPKAIEDLFRMPEDDGFEI